VKKKIPAILAAMLLTFGISVVSAAPSFASTTQVRCAYVKNFVIPGGYGALRRSGGDQVWSPPAARSMRRR